MRFILTFIGCMFATLSFSDTMEHYLGIANQIPQMEMKADPKSQSWARSGRSVLALTNEAIAETLLQTNETATRAGHPFFCLPTGVQLNATVLNSIILNTFRDIGSQPNEKNKMSISQVAFMGVIKTYPCQAEQKSSGMQHIEQ